jgi:glycosyltransferase involved in cell wall biosynthesis
MINTANLVNSISRNSGGLHESVRRLVQSLTQQSVGVRVLTVEDEFTQSDLAVWKPVEVEVFPRVWPQSFGYSPFFLPALERLRPDLTHTHGIWQYPSIATAVYCHRRRVPYMISPHGMLDPWAVRHHRWKKVLAFAIYESDHVRGARCIRALCESEARSIRQMGLKNPVAIIPNGIDLPEMEKQKTESRNVPWAGKLKPGQKVLLFLSRIHPKKGLVNLLKAWAQVQKSEGRGQKSDEWVLAIAGWDQDGHEAELKQLATEQGIQWADVREQRTERGDRRSDSFQLSTFNSQPAASLLFLGPQFNEAKAACYAACDAFILPSFSEGLPMVVLEAWAYAKPVVMTPECNLPEGFAASAALKIETDVESLTLGLTELFRLTSADLGTLGAHGQRLVRERFTWSAIAGQLKTTYEWMLGGGAQPGWMHQD